MCVSAVRPSLPGWPLGRESYKSITQSRAVSPFSAGTSPNTPAGCSLLLLRKDGRPAGHQCGSSCSRCVALPRVLSPLKAWHGQCTARLSSLLRRGSLQCTRAGLGRASGRGSGGDAGTSGKESRPRRRLNPERYHCGDVQRSRREPLGRNRPRGHLNGGAMIAAPRITEYFHECAHQSSYPPIFIPQAGPGPSIFIPQAGPGPQATIASVSLSTLRPPSTYACKLRHQRKPSGSDFRVLSPAPDIYRDFHYMLPYPPCVWQLLTRGPAS